MQPDKDTISVPTIKADVDPVIFASHCHGWGYGVDGKICTVICPNSYCVKWVDVKEGRLDIHPNGPILCKWSGIRVIDNVSNTGVVVPHMDIHDLSALTEPYSTEVVRIVVDIRPSRRNQKCIPVDVLSLLSPWTLETIETMTDQELQQLVGVPRDVAIDSDATDTNSRRVASPSGPWAFMMEPDALDVTKPQKTLTRGTWAYCMAQLATAAGMFTDGAVPLEWVGNYQFRAELPRGWHTFRVRPIGEDQDLT